LQRNGFFITRKAPTFSRIAPRQAQLVRKLSCGIARPRSTQEEATSSETSLLVAATAEEDDRRLSVMEKEQEPETTGAIDYDGSSVEVRGDDQEEEPPQPPPLPGSRKSA
jgi:hypothetical protein